MIAAWQQRRQNTVQKYSIREATCKCGFRLGVPSRKTLPTRMVEDTRLGAGKQGYEDRMDTDRQTLKKPATSVRDSDQDGLPDDWERTRQLDPNNAADASKITQDGYTGLERYCHHLAASRIETASKSTL